MASSTKRVFNEMATFEKDSCKYIDPSQLYIVKITIDDASLTEDSLKKILSAELHDQAEPLAIYYDSANVYIIFSYVVENYYFPDQQECQTYKHQFEGDHHMIISKYACNFQKLLPESRIVAKIIEFETQNQMTIYLTCLVYTCTQEAFVKYSNGKIREDILQFRTQSELKIMFNDLAKTCWEDLSNHKKYGTFLKLKRKKHKITTVEYSIQAEDKDIKKILFD